VALKKRRALKRLRHRSDANEERLGQGAACPRRPQPLTEAALPWQPANASSKR
jgi:hypothetical protein